MQVEAIATLMAIGLLSGVISGVLGIGGGIVLAPMLLYVPPLILSSVIDMKNVSGLTMVQSSVASLSAAIVHRRLGKLHSRLVLQLGVPVAVASLLGALASAAVAEKLLLVLFAAMAVAAGLLMFVPRPNADADVELEAVSFSKWGAIACGGALGLLGGMVGQSGSFLLMPVMIYVLGIPTRIAVGSSLGVVLCAALAGTLGKLVAGQVAASLALPLIPGALLGANLGGRLSGLLPARSLRYGVGVVSALAAARVIYGLS